MYVHTFLSITDLFSALNYYDQWLPGEMMIILFMSDFKLCAYSCNRDGRNNEGPDLIRIPAPDTCSLVSRVPG